VNFSQSPLLSPTARVALGLALLTLLAYLNSFAGFYLFDDAGAVIDNSTIRHFSTALAPLTNGTPVSGRPLVNLTFAMNYAVSGLAVWSYHAVNLAIHLFAALALFGLVRRTLLLPSIAPRFRSAALEIAATVAALWAVHPLQTEAVSYLSQRAEELMGLFYLLTLYAFARSVDGDARGWRALAVTACLAGMASKEVMVSAPLLVLLYDRTFYAGSFAAALRRRAGFYLALAATWLLLAWEMIHVGSRGDSVGSGLKIDSWHYALTQGHAIALYLGLCFWPHPLIFDYGTTTAASLRAVAPEAALVAALVVATLVLVARRSALGFIGAWFFAILAPSSSIVPLAKQTIAEHRMYLPLAAVIVLVVLAVHAICGRARLAAILVVPLIALTLLRNDEYRNGITIWNSSVAHYPANPRAHINLGDAYVNFGQAKLGEAQFVLALRLDPSLPEVHNNLGVVEAGLGKTAEARAQYREAMRLSPGWDKPRENLEHLDAATHTAAPKSPAALFHHRNRHGRRQDLVLLLAGAHLAGAGPWRDWAQAHRGGRTRGRGTAVRGGRRRADARRNQSHPLARTGRAVRGRARGKAHA
jgi:tetratricopeptide (TPR) repeat protein